MKKTVLPPTFVWWLAAGLCGCVAQPRLEPPQRCSTRFPATTAVWTYAREQTKAQAAACFDWRGAEGVSAKATQGVMRIALVCPLVPVTPAIDAYFAVAMTPFLAPLDLLATRECGHTTGAGEAKAEAADQRPAIGGSDSLCMNGGSR